MRVARDGMQVLVDFGAKVQFDGVCVRSARLAPLATGFGVVAAFQPTARCERFDEAPEMQWSVA